MAECIGLYVRYETVQKNGLTRREYNAQFDVVSPEIDIPAAFRYVWDWFFEINSSVDRAGDGHCRPITWADYMGWAQITGTLVHPSEYDMLRAMDAAFVSEMNKEIAAQRARAANG